MNKDLKKELLKYTSAAAAVLTGASAQGQFIYTDIPDTTIDANGAFYNLDLNQDGTTDFTITQYVDTGAQGNTNAVIIQPYNSGTSQVAGEQIGQYNYPFNLQSATILDANTGWNGTGGTHKTGYMAFVVGGQSYPNSNWVGPIQDGFLGLVLFDGQNIYHGWARLDIGADSESFTIKDFEYNTVADSSMRVGNALLGEVENTLQSVSLRIGDGFIAFEKPDAIDDLNIRLFDVSGKLLASAKMRDNQFEIETGQLATSLYIIEMESNGILRREKVFIY